MSTRKFIQGAGVKPRTSSLAKIPSMTKVSSHGPKNQIYKFMASDGSDREFYAFRKDIEKSKIAVLASMFIPSFFTGMTSEIRGQFLLEVDQFDKKKTDGFFLEIKIGKQGCGYHIVLPEEGMFTFNGFTYHPFILRTLTICYYACETNSKQDQLWKKSTYAGVAVEGPIVYDHRLDLFVTSDAERRKI